MEILKFVVPPAIGSLGVAKLIASQPSALRSLQVGIGCLATVATASYYICKKYAPKQHTKHIETAADNQEGPERTDLEAIYEEQRSIKTQIPVSYTHLTLPTILLV